MAKQRPKIDNGRQGDFFTLLLAASRDPHPGQAPHEGELNDDALIRSMLNEALKRCPLSRWEVAGKMSHMVGENVTKYMLDAWTSEAKDGHRFPLAWARAFCTATGHDGCLRRPTEKAGLFVLQAPDALRAEVEKKREARRELDREIREGETFLKLLEAKP